MRSIWFSYHIPKTGGQTLRNHLHTTLGEDGYLHLGKWDVGDKTVRPEDPAEVDQTVRASMSAVGGHPLHRRHRSLFPNRELREVIFVREPARRIISLYNFRLGRAVKADEPFPSFEGWLSTRPNNPQTKFAARRLGLHHKHHLNTLVHEFDRLWFAGVTERLDDALPLILSSMGLPPTIPPRANLAPTDGPGLVSPDPALMERLRAENTDDVALHRICLALHDRNMVRLQRALDP